MKLTTILFDFDGTLADTLPVCFYSLREVFRSYDGVELDNAGIVALFGPTEPEIIRINLKQNHQADEAVNQFFQLYDEHHQELVKASPAIHAMIVALKQASYRVGVVTGKGSHSLAISLKHLGMEGLFDVEISGDDVQDPKPHPEGVLLAMSRLNVSAEETMFLGDSIADIRAGKGAGVLTAAVQWFEHVQTRDFEVTPDLLFTNPVQVTDYLKADRG